MEHPSKRRRIERRPTGSLRALLHLDEERQALKARAIVPLASPNLVISPSTHVKKDDIDPSPALSSRRGRSLSIRKLKRRGATKPPVTTVADQAQPIYNAANNAAQPAAAPAANALQPVQQTAQVAADAQQPTQNYVDSKAQAQAQQTTNNVVQPPQQAAQPAVNQVQQTTGNAVAPVQQATEPVTNQAQSAVKSGTEATQNHVVQPVENAANDAVKPVVDKVPDVTEAVQTPPVNQNETPGAAPATSPQQDGDDGTGVVTPPAAVAAAAAREKALADQQAKAAQQNPDVPSSEGPAPAKNPGTAGNSLNVAIPSQDAQLLSGSFASTSAATTQLSASVSSTTPLPTSPPSITSSSVPTLSQPTPTFPPTLLPGIISSNSQLTGANSTLISSSSIIATSSGPLPTSVTSSRTDSFDFAAVSASHSLPSAEQTASSNASSSLTIVTSSEPSTILISTPTASSSAFGSISPSGSATASPTGDEGFGAGSPTSNGAASTSSSAGSGAGGSNGAPPTGALVGGICGGVAGLVLVFAALLFLLRYRKRKSDHRREISPPIPQSAGAGSAALGGGVMTQRSSIRSTAPIAAAANLIGRLRPGSSQTATTTSTIPSEKGFQKLSGRKLESVLQSGGDGYGEKTAVAGGAALRPGPKSIAPGQSHFAGLAPGLRPPSPQRSLSGSSFYRDSHGFYGGVVPIDSASEDKTVSSASPTSSSPTIPVGPTSGTPFAAAGHPPGRSSPGVPNMRPGPARQPVIQQGGVMPIRTPSRPGTSQQRPTTSPIAEHPFPRDPLGRSHPSQDGSRQSRFRESTTPP